jgi:NADH dehydrogenase
VGGGFGGIEAVKGLRAAAVDVTLVDRHNYHLFQPLTYQVATGTLSPDEIAEPLRVIFRRQRRVHVVMAEVTALDIERRVVVAQPAVGGAASRTLPYDTLIVAAGSAYSYFGHDEWRAVALEVKSLESALRVRSRILQAFEAAEAEPDAEARARWLTFVVVGGGPTGVEVAGQIAELAQDTLSRDHRCVDARDARVLLVEAGSRVLPSFPASLSERAMRSLQEIGVAPTVSRTVVGVDADGVDVRDPRGGVGNADVPLRAGTVPRARCVPRHRPYARGTTRPWRSTPRPGTRTACTTAPWGSSTSSMAPPKPAKAKPRCVACAACTRKATQAQPDAASAPREAVPRRRAHRQRA